MDKVYLVTTGEYSDYRVHSVYSTKEKAERVANVLLGHVSERTLDEGPGFPRGMLYYEVAVDRQGTVRECNLVSADFVSDTLWEPAGDGECVQYNVWAKNDDHAIKIAAERNAELVASGNWTIEWDKWEEIMREEDKREEIMREELAKEAGE